MVIFHVMVNSCCANGRGGRYSGYIAIPRYYYEPITVSRKISLSGIIAISILSWFAEESLYAVNYRNRVRMLNVTLNI